MVMPPIRNSEVLRAVLLEVLSQHPSGLPIQNAYDTVASTYEFPEDWHRQIPGTAGYAEPAKLGYSDHQQVPQETLIALVPTEPDWQNEMRWSRNTLRKEGLLDTSAPRGIWRLTDQGFRAVEGGLLAGLNSEEQRIVKSRRPSPPKPVAQSELLGEAIRRPCASLLNEN